MDPLTTRKRREQWRGWGGGCTRISRSCECVTWPRRWDDFVHVATWIHLVTPDKSLPGGASPYRILFGRESRSHIDVVTQALGDDSSFGHGLERAVTDQQRMTQEILRQRHDAQNRQRERHKAKVARESPGAKTVSGSLVLVKEPSNMLHRDSLHPKLAHDHYTPPWRVTTVMRDRPSFTIQLNGRRIRQRRVAATDVKQ